MNSGHLYLGTPPTAVGGYFKSFLLNRCYFNRGIPPTAVGGWFKSYLLSRNLNVSAPTATARFIFAVGAKILGVDLL
jgi:hypothetical protein